MENVLFSDRIQVERKLFFFDLKENPRGRFLKITEDVSGRGDTIIVPTSGLEFFRESLEKVLNEEMKRRAQDPQPSPVVSESHDG